MIIPAKHQLDPRLLPSLRNHLHTTAVYTTAAFWWLVLRWPGEPKP